MAEKPKKKVVRAQPIPSASSKSSGSSTSKKDQLPEITWKATPEAKAEAGKLRLFAWIAWALAIAGEAFAVFWVLRQPEIKMWLLIVMIVVIGGLALGGSLVWKKANRLDPASKRDTIKFFVQNQLGAIMTVIAFLPLIIMVFLNKDMDGKQKGIAGGIGIVVMLVVGYFASDLNPPSQEQYSDETRIVLELTGKDEVVWTKSGSVFHLCAEASDMQRESKDNEVHVGTVAQAHAAGKSRLTKKVEMEIKQCGLDINDYNPNPTSGTDLPESTDAPEDADAPEGTDSEGSGEEGDATDSADEPAEESAQ